MHRPMREVARLSREVTGLAILADEVEQRLDEVDERATRLAIGANNVAHALERTDELVTKLETLEARAIVVEAAFAGREKPVPPWQDKAAAWLRERAEQQRSAKTERSEASALVLELAADAVEDDDIPW